MLHTDPIDKQKLPMKEPRSILLKMYQGIKINWKKQISVLPDKVLDQALAQLEEYYKPKLETSIILPEIEKAHTYASENAEVYRAYDAGQKRYKERIEKLYITNQLRK